MAQTMFRVPNLPLVRENKNFKIDRNRSVLPDIPSTDATTSMRHDWRKFYTSSECEDGPERAEIDEIENINIQRPIWTENEGMFYEGLWRGHPVFLRFTSLYKLDRRRLFNERDCFALAQSERVLKLYATCLDFSRLTGNFVTQTFKCTLRSLYDDFVPKRITARSMIQLAEGLKHIHGKNIVLRNISPENVLVLSNGNLVYSHFGDAVQLNDSGIYQDTNRVGLAEYAALETLQRNPGSNKYHYSKSSDVYSLGCVFFEIWTSNSLAACPRHLIPNDYYEFYVGVLQNGRPLTRKRSGTNQMEFYVTNERQYETIFERLEINLRLACPDGLEESFIDLFKKMLIFPWNSRISAENILLSQAFCQVRQIFDVSDNTNNIQGPENLPNSNYEVSMNYSVEEKENIRSKQYLFYGFSAVYDRPFDTVVTTDSSSKIIEGSSGFAGENQHMVHSSNQPTGHLTQQSGGDTQHQQDFTNTVHLAKALTNELGSQIENEESKNHKVGMVNQYEMNDMMSPMGSQPQYSTLSWVDNTLDFLKDFPSPRGNVMP